ncbi:iron uptake transporter permease EfeU [Propionicimonas sp.]|uniref:iron uptake transporter permease EfeU n=1 Tax=Propionicimonas sp. TaxID=1955623 RepID=UPI00184496F1|nr:iron uptake transporter permease EfeU [Propionicimonas sp.]MBU3976684.1 FTR1 family protein [Actinomycetota bacterium]MBA3019750.1 high-affinity Fe2+/Pb2+ permease [Propionicimonas sp.]MBU3986779.1 FTR1 family protein [Actinomycetota bacterium]MBU4006691.1 FTR1 family protein [Actinomycetota bacterium]MBU4065391.1 FTR1 family protein [Actinomycetota bacterium]
MFLASFLIGLREGLEAALIVGILVAFVHKRGRSDVLAKIWWGVGLSIAIAVSLGAVFTFGAYGLSFESQEIIGGAMSLLAVAMVTWMVFWMLKAGHRMKAELESNAAGALAVGTGWAIAWIAFLSVGREGLETTLMLWGWALQPEALLGALVGILAAVAIGHAVFRGMVRLNFGTFFTYTGAFLIIVAAGILAYGIHDLQEAAVLPGPFSGLPITPTDLGTGEVLVGLTDGPFWMAAFPFGWAFDLTAVIDPTGVWAILAKATVGFTPLMSWLEVTAWASYLLIVLPRFVAAVRRNRAAARAARSTMPSLDQAPVERASAPAATPSASPEQAPAKVLVPERNPS